MHPEIACPRCGHPVNPSMPTCPNCGINLTLAAIIVTEEAFAATQIEAAGAPITPEILVPRLGEILLEKKVIQPSDLQRALDVSKKLTSENRPRLLGQILLDLKLINRETLDEVVTQQILQLQTALQHANTLLEKRVQERTQELQQALNKLAELSKMKSNFISSISHELRTPLTHMKGYLDLISDGSLGPLTDEQTTAMDVLLRSESRLEQLIEDLIRFSLAARDEFTLHPGPVDIGGVIHSAVAQSARHAKEKDLFLSATVLEKLPLVEGDQEKLTWVILQLLDNAIKFNKHEGEVSISAKLVEGKIVINVIDTGIGIPADQLDEIFEPFHQLDSADSRHYGGTGLGLALVRRIVEAHGSLIKVESQIGKGSRFEFTLSPKK